MQTDLSSQSNPSVKDRIRESIAHLLQFLKNPLQGMKELPNWKWNQMIFLIGAMGALCGGLSGVVAGQPLSIVAGILFFPISVVVSIGLSAGFFYYVFLFFYKREIDFKQISTHVMFASIPMLLLAILSPLVPVIHLLGFVTTLILLLVGFKENFNLPKKPILKLLVGIFLIYIIFWFWNSINFHKVKNNFRDQASPESLDILEKELNAD